MRNASLISSATEILFALGLAEQVVAVSHECDYPPAARRLPRATHSLIDAAASSGQIDQQVRERSAGGQALYEIDAGLLCDLRPDLIVTQAQCDVCAVRHADVVDLVKSRSELSGTTIVALNPQSLDDVLADVERVAAAANAVPAGRKFRHELSRRIAAIGDLTEVLPAADRPRVVCLEWLDPLMVAGNWTPGLIELAGGRSELATAGRHSQYATWEAVREANPDVLLIAPCGFDLARSQFEAQRLLALPGLVSLAAIEKRRSFVIDGNAYLNRSGPRLVDSLELVAHLIQPAIFPRSAGELSIGRSWSRWPIG
jgi:iron complex transport system substrate-binding protein